MPAHMLGRFEAFRTCWSRRIDNPWGNQASPLKLTGMPACIHGVAAGVPPEEPPPAIKSRLSAANPIRRHFPPFLHPSVLPPRPHPSSSSVIAMVREGLR